MTTRSRGPLAGFDWLKRGTSLAFRHPKPLFGGAAFLFLACLAPTLISLPMQLHAVHSGTPLSSATSDWIMAASMLFSLLLLPLYAGFLQIIDASERGLPARALDIFKPYRQGDALRYIGFGLVVLLVYVALIGVIIVATGSGIVSWYLQAITLQASHQQAPALPGGFAIFFALLMGLGHFMMGFYAISFGQVTLHRRSVFGAIGDGLKGALKNLLPLLVFVVCAVVARIDVAVVFVIAALLLTLLGKLVDVWLMLVLMVPLYIALALGMFTVMFGVMYYLWCDVCGDGSEPDRAPVIAA